LLSVNWATYGFWAITKIDEKEVLIFKIDFPFLWLKSVILLECIGDSVSVSLVI
jgi:hypothetical protein